MANAHAPDTSHYYIPHDSPWPIRGSLALFAIMLGAVSFFNDWAGGWAFLPGVILIAYMFFAAFFGALFYARTLSVPWLAGQGVKVFTNFLLWPHYEGTWPTNGPAHVGGHADSTFETIGAIGLPLINTAILLTSGITITIAHHALRASKRGTLTLFLALTFLLGFTFVGLQAHEYGEAYKELGLKLSTGIYGSTFFMLTGFHGLHVTIGAIMLTVIWLRVLHEIGRASCRERV